MIANDPREGYDFVRVGRLIDFAVVDAFTDRPFAGNAAAVVPDAAGLSDAEMQLIAREMGLAETVFVLPSTAADVRIRWFTPKTEVSLCGHATIACFARLSELGRLPAATLRVETASGVLGVSVEGPTVWFSLPVPNFSYWRGDKKKLADAMTIPMGATAEEHPIVTDGAYVYVPVRRLEVLRGLMIREDLLRALQKDLSLAVFTAETIEPTSDWHLRFFAPALGVPEDPVTGSANGPLGVYFFQHMRSRKEEYCGEQGDFVGRPGRVRVRVAATERDVTGVSIGGTAVTVTEGRVRLG